MHDFGERIRKLRVERGLTLQQIGEHFDIQRSSVSDWENGRTYPDARRLIKLAHLLNTSVEFLLTGREEASWPLHPIERARIVQLPPQQLEELTIAISAALAMIEAKLARHPHNEEPSPRKTGTTGRPQ
ncbi:helix-turn-helix domain-containing protein [Achromobacter mucicolens]|uniref:Helix-turn-helix domain-containing protein n=1 Tax=Achromobacter mucicolens TaxID=1389922 RepID=A0ABD4Z131_9BURK|nr:helix-turn-helix transcriptional regulator [Achromobacter mucicolens]MDG9971590.1 helix-turn-helix domain-containing protein [Achromobacter mucicolens]MDH1181275.1 helix-turn-helix domain-containing protein [Achromobacter mucicolens]